MGGIAGMLILSGVVRNAALGAALLNRGWEYRVPLSGGGPSHVVLRHQFSRMGTLQETPARV